MRRTILFSLLLLLCVASPALAQSCGSGEVLLKNDILPDIPIGPTPVAIVPGLCDGEALMNVFSTFGSVELKKVSVMFANNFGAGGVAAVVDLEIYDGATFNGNGTVSLGNLVYKHSTVTGTNIQISTHGINELDVSMQGIVVNTGTVVLGWRMILNTASGSCLLGYTSNFAVDNAQTCTPGINILDAQGHGPVDPMTYLGFGTPLCPRFYNGSVISRACVQELMSVQWTGNPTPGGVLSLEFTSPSDPNMGYFALAAGSATTGIPLPPFGTLPLDPDFWFLCFLSSCRPLGINWAGVLNGQGKAFGGMLIPNEAVLSGSCLNLVLAFWTHSPGNPLAISNISPPSRTIKIQ